MIQRIQSVFLLISFLLSVILLYVPAYDILDSTGLPRSYAVKENALLLILNGAIGVISFITIFLFKIRNVQMRLTNLGLLLTCILAGLMFFVADTLSSGLNQQVRFTYGCYLPLIQLVMIFLAGRFIRRDENLVRSADRLR